MEISIVTPWLNHSELIDTYETATAGTEIIIVDNGSDAEHADRLIAMTLRLGGKFIRNETNEPYAKANNQGMREATGDIIIFMNNDVEAPYGWHNKIEVPPSALVGPSKLHRAIDGHKIDYIEGYCIGGRRETWEELGGWNETDFTGNYWEDNDLCFRAMMKGIKLIKANWPVWHFNNYTSRNTPGAYDYSAINQAKFEKMVKDAIEFGKFYPYP